jgi:hypothetical protein
MPTLRSIRSGGGWSRGAGCPEISFSREEPGHQKIDYGLNEGRQGLTLLVKGQKQYQIGTRRSAKLAHAGVERMIQGGRMVQEALDTIQDGVKMNNEVLRAKNLASDVEEPSRTILKITESGLTGIKQFLDRQKLVLENN